MQIELEHNGQPITLSAEPQDGGWRVTLPDGSERVVTVDRDEAAGLLRVREGDRAFTVPFARDHAGVSFAWQGQAYNLAPRATGRAARTTRLASGTLVAPMVGVVAAILVEEGQEVEAHQPLAVVEAMKVLATLEAPFAGRVAKLHVAPRQQVAHGQAILEVEPI